MTDTIIYVRTATVDEDRVCIPRLGDRDDGCEHHGHVPGNRRLILDVVPDCFNDATAAAFIALIGKRCRVVPA